MIGVERLGFYTPEFVLPLSVLAKHQGHESSYYENRIGQSSMSVMPPDQDIVTMALNACEALGLTEKDRASIHWVLFATESGLDQSKSAGLFLHEWLGLSSRCRVLEIKQACYGATGALRLAHALLKEVPHQKVLVLGSDVAHYAFDTPAEASQGAGAVAMLLSTTPRLGVLSFYEAVHSQAAMDFWRPPYRLEALVNGKASSKLYLQTLESTYRAYEAASGLHWGDHDYFCFHVPVSGLVERAYRLLQKLSKVECDMSGLDVVLRHNRSIGNCYTASLYLSWLSLLEGVSDLSGARVGCFSYGSGCMAEYFNIEIQSGYASCFSPISELLDRRCVLDMETYRSYQGFRMPEDGSRCEVDRVSRARYFIESYDGYQCFYGGL